MGQNQSRYSVLIAIDFGTGYTGYAYSYSSSKETIHLNRNLGGADNTHSIKTPTSALYDSSTDSFYFGHEAEDKYFKRIEERGNSAHLELYKCFKMQLFEEEDEIGFHRIGHKLRSENLKEKLAMDVFVDILKHIKEHATNAIHLSEGLTLQERDTRWVVTVPAIWKDQQKMFMREACHKAELISELYSENLKIALESECASLYCKALHLDRVVGSNQMWKPNLKIGDIYMTVDLGGGTTDIAVHKVTRNKLTRSDNVISLIPPKGGPYGGNNVNEGFVNLIKELLGQKFVNDLQKEKPSTWLKLVKDFESKKRGFKSGQEVSLDISAELLLFYNIGRSIDKVSETNAMKISDGKRIIIKPAAMEQLFDDLMIEINKLIKDALNMLHEENRSNVLKHMFLVGGFSESKYVRDKILSHQTSYLRNVTVSSPHEASVCVLKGAISFGHQPDFIKSRISGRTYAFGEQDEQKHLEILVQKGQNLPEGLVVKKQVIISSLVRSIDRLIFVSQRKSITKSSDPKVSVLCLVRVSLRQTEDRNQDQPITLQFIFGQTELHVKPSNESLVDVKLEFVENANI